jgi:hypothetical protein
VTRLARRAGHVRLIPFGMAVDNNHSSRQVMFQTCGKRQPKWRPDDVQTVSDDDEDARVDVDGGALVETLACSQLDLAISTVHHVSQSGRVKRDASSHWGRHIKTIVFLIFSGFTGAELC